MFDDDLPSPPPPPADWPHRLLAFWSVSYTHLDVYKRQSLIGAHRINSNVGSDINFNLAQDYMPGLQASTAQQADGSVMIRWGALQPATGYVAWTIGGMDRGGGNGDMVWWTSSASKEFGGGLWDWLPPSVVALSLIHI